jgi:hypothetical protein
MRRLILICSLISAVLLAPVARATNNAIASADWFNISTWDAGTIPQDGDGENDVRIENSFAVAIATGNASTHGRLSVGVNSQGALNLGGGTLTVRDRIAMGSLSGSAATVDISGGQVLVDSVSATSTLEDGSLTVGRQGDGSFVMEGSNAMLSLAGRFYVGDIAGSTGTYLQSGGMATVGSEMRLGNNGEGFAQVTNASLVTARLLRVGRNAGSLGSMYIGNGGFVRSNRDLGSGAMIGREGEGHLTVDGGTFLMGPDDSIGTSANGRGHFYVGGGSGGTGSGRLVLLSGRVQSGGGILVGAEATRGSVEVHGGLLTADGNINLGSGVGGLGSLTVTGGTVRTNEDLTFNRALLVGDDGTGVASIAGGYVNVRGNLRLGVNAGATGTYLQTAGVVDVGLGDDGMGSGGGFGVVIGEDAGGRGFARISGGTLIDHDMNGANPQMQVGAAGNGVLEIAGTAVVETRSHVVIGTDAGSTGTLAIEGGRLRVDGDVTIANNPAATATLTQTGGLLEVDGSIMNTNGGTHAFSGGKLTRVSAGNIDYQGDLTISSDATIGFDADKTMTISGGFDATGGGVFDLDGVMLTAGLGDYFFLTVGDPQGIGGGDDLTDNISLEAVGLERLIDLFAAMRISELDFEQGNFNPATQSVFALVEGEISDGDGMIGLRWSVVPEPSPEVLLLVSAVVGVLMRRRRD